MFLYLFLLEYKSMIIHKENAQVFTIPGGTSGLLYPASPKGDQSLAVVETHGVYPEKGYSINDICTETLYMLEGEFQLHYNNDVFLLKPGDVFMVLPGNKYKIIGNGKACVLISPSWDSAQNHIIEI